MNVNTNRLMNVPAAKWTKGERELVRVVQGIVAAERAFGFEWAELFSELRAYHGLSLGEAIATAREDLSAAVERNELTDLDTLARESWQD